MALTFRDVKGSPLSSAEVDENFRTLQDEVDAILPPPGVGIASITTTATTWTVHYTNATSDGPFPLPARPGFVYSFDWVPLTHYDLYEVFTVPDVGVYLVLQEGGYDSPTDFDPDQSNTDGPELQLMFGVPTLPKIPVTHVPSGDHTLVPADSGAYIRMEDDGVAVHVLHDDDFVEGDVITIRRVSGQVDILASDTVTVINLPSDCLPILRTAGSTATLIYVGADEWDLSGDLALAETTTTTGT